MYIPQKCKKYSKIILISLGPSRWAYNCWIKCTLSLNVTTYCLSFSASKGIAKGNLFLHILCSSTYICHRYLKLHFSKAESKRTLLIALSSFFIDSFTLSHCPKLLWRVKVIPMMMMRHRTRVSEKEYQQARDQDQQSAQCQLHFSDLLSGLFSYHGRDVVHEMPQSIYSRHPKDSDQLSRTLTDTRLVQTLLTGQR